MTATALMNSAAQLEQPTITSRLMNSAAVRARYDVSGRSLDRWINDAQLGFPKPIMINSRRYWYEAELLAWERTRARRTA